MSAITTEHLYKSLSFTKSSVQIFQTFAEAATRGVPSK